MNVNEFSILNRKVGDTHPTYFIADISANHDGDLERAKALIHLAAEAGADAAKFQNFRAEKIVSDFGFRNLGQKQSHQSKWKKSVFEVYQDATVPWDWTEILKKECDHAGIHYFSTPYDLEAVDMLDPYVPAYKIGSGDITWLEIQEKIAEKKKPVILAAGASTLEDVQRAVSCVSKTNSAIGLMQCNTNYTASIENFRHIHLRVLETFRLVFPNVVLGLSDHTSGHATVLGAVALGARMIEKHFTDDTKRIGPDHPFSMTPATWREMVDRTRELELSLGQCSKQIADNELETVVVQRRCVRAARALAAGTALSRDQLTVLRPAPVGSIAPWDIGSILGKKLRKEVVEGEHLTWSSFE
ncbi:MAG: N-acetylneuraminate synthase family protein [Nibricoccus sp.]